MQYLFASLLSSSCVSLISKREHLSYVRELQQLGFESSHLIPLIYEEHKTEQKLVIHFERNNSAAHRDEVTEAVLDCFSALSMFPGSELLLQKWKNCL